MIEQIEVLIRLQSISNELIKLKRNKEYRYNDITDFKKKVKEKDMVVEEAEKKFKSFQVKMDNKELDLKGIESEIDKFKVQLNQIKNNKEYTALKSEIGLKEADKSVIEDEVLKMMDGLEEERNKVNELKNDVKQDEIKLAQLNKAIEDDVKRIDDEIKTVIARRDGLVETLEKDPKHHFQRLIKSTDGVAVAAVVNNACQRCFFTVTPQTINQLLSEKELVFCLSCGRILYMNNKDVVFPK